MSSINQKTIPSVDLRATHEGDELHEPRNTVDESALGEGNKAKEHKPVITITSAKHPPKKELTTEQLNRNFLKTIVDRWNPRDQTMFIQDFSPFMLGYLELAARKRE